MFKRRPGLSRKFAERRATISVAPIFEVTSVSAPRGSRSATSASITMSSGPPSGEAQVLGTHAELERRGPIHAARKIARQPRLHPTQIDAAAAELAIRQVHRRRADESGHEQCRRPVVEVVGRVVLHALAGRQDADAVRHRQRLDLVVGDVDDGRTQPLMQALDLAAHLSPSLGVEVRQRFVEPEHLRLAHDRVADRHPLALPA